jgi:serine/threonine-protein kinase
MGHEPDDEQLLAIAGAISDRTSIDWNQVRETFRRDTRLPILEELRLLQGVAAVHDEPRTWGSLSIRSVLGEGAFARVYHAFDPELDRDVALKVSRVSTGTTADSQLVVNEARMLARVRHPNVVTVFGAQRRADELGVVMELIRGRTLEDLVKANGPFSAREAAVILVDVCRALAAVHDAGLLHGDIKAHNVMREEGGRIVLMDFGAGRDARVSGTARAAVAGTPIYLAPELFAGLPPSPASDIYSLGVLAYYLSSGTYPVEGETGTQIRRVHSDGIAPTRIRDVRPELPERFVRIVERATARDPEQRFRTAGEFEAALVAMLASATAGGHAQMMTRVTIGVALLLVVALAGFGLRELTADRNAVTTATGAVPAGYQVEAALYRLDGARPVRLGPSERISKGDLLFLNVQTSVPAYVYLLNEDDAGGEPRLLFPPKDVEPSPLPPAGPVKLPLEDGVYWQVTTEAPREHFVVFVSPERLTRLEEEFRALSAPGEAPRVMARSEDQDQEPVLRSVGGVAKGPSMLTPRPRFSSRFTTPLTSGPEHVTGMWARQLVVSQSTR